MDGFDDLLAPSRRALEDNPFEDPFAQPRSNSPDPWASYSHNPEHNPFYQEEASEHYAEPEPELGPVSNTDPLESATVNELEPPSPDTPTVKPPGFRESAPSPELRRPPLPDPELEHTHPVSPIPKQSTSPSPPPASKYFPSFSPTHSPRPTSSFGKPNGAVVSPLDEASSTSGFENSFASLALGGESLGGWQSAAQSTFVNGPSGPVSREPSLDEDDEDNRPVLQPPRPKSYEPVTVCSTYSSKFCRFHVVQQTATTSMPSSSLTDKNKGIQPVFSITVDDPQRVGDPIRAYTMYTVHTRVSHSRFPESSFTK
jgi:sorting nexin-1/2